MGQGAESAGGYEIEYNPYEEDLPLGNWTQRDGSSIHVSKMDNRHIKNSINLCRNMRDSSTFSCDSDMWQEWIDLFESELYSRSRDKAKTVKTQPVEKAKPRGRKVKLRCHCGKEYEARAADLKRGWGKSCSKRCAAIKRDYGRPDPIVI